MKKNNVKYLGKKMVIAMIATFAAMTVGACGQAAENEALENPALEVTMSQQSGCYDDSFDLSITSDGAAKIYYTTDGSNPTTSTTRVEYTSAVNVKDRSGANGADNYVTAVDPVLFDCANLTFSNGVAKDKYKAPSKEAVDKATVIKAVAMDGTGNYSPVVTNTYFVGAMNNHIAGIKESCEAAGVPLSIMSISMDYADLFDSTKGIYVKGDIFNKEFDKIKDGFWNGSDISETCRGLDANYKQKGIEWERAAHIDYFESDGTTTECKLQQDCGIRTQGNYSRSDMQKGLRLYARDTYGKKNFKYNFFGGDTLNSIGEPMDKYKKLTLRAGGNSAFIAKYNDAYWQSLIKDLKCETQSSRVCVVYIDGEYWGLYILQEDYCGNYWEEKYGVNKDSVVSYKGDGEKYDIGYEIDDGDLPEGQEDIRYFWNDLLKFYDTYKDLSSQEAYNAFTKMVDVESVRDYFATNFWLNNKWDWPGKNWLAWKTTDVDANNPYADGRWRLCFCDLDFGGSSQGDYRTNTVETDFQRNASSTVYSHYGMVDLATDNPVVLMFAYMMTNDTFRNDFTTKLLDMSSTTFGLERASAKLEQYKNTYGPLYKQFFDRYDGNGSYNDAVNGGYLSYSTINEFITNRGKSSNKYIQQQVDYINNNYGRMSESRGVMAMSGTIDTQPTQTPDGTTTPDATQTPAISPAPTSVPTQTPNTVSKNSKKKISTLAVTAKKGKKSITVKTLKKANVKITLSKKIIKNGKKVTKTIAIKAAKNKSGKVTVKLSKALEKKMKITVVVSKSGYTAKKKVLTVK